MFVTCLVSNIVIDCHIFLIIFTRKRHVKGIEISEVHSSTNSVEQRMPSRQEVG